MAPNNDRNRNAAAAFEFAQARGQFIRAWDEGKVRLLDRFGHPIEKDHYVMFRPAEDLIYEVKECGPSMNSNHPPGTVRLVLEVTVPMLYNVPQLLQMAGGRVNQISICGEKKVAPDGTVESQVHGPVLVPGEAPYDLGSGELPAAQESTASEASEESKERKPS